MRKDRSRSGALAMKVASLRASTSAHMCVDIREQFQLLAAQRNASIAAKYEATYEATHEATAASSEALDRTSVSSLRRGICESSLHQLRAADAD